MAKGALKPCRLISPLISWRAELFWKHMSEYRFFCESWGIFFLLNQYSRQPINYSMCNFIDSQTFLLANTFENIRSAQCQPFCLNVLNLLYWSHMLVRYQKSSESCSCNWIGLHLFNDNTCPSGNISHPSYSCTVIWEGHTDRHKKWHNHPSAPLASEENKCMFLTMAIGISLHYSPAIVYIDIYISEPMCIHKNWLSRDRKLLHGQRTTSFDSDMAWGATKDPGNIVLSQMIQKKKRKLMT